VDVRETTAHCGRKPDVWQRLNRIRRADNLALNRSFGSERLSRNPVVFLREDYWPDKRVMVRPAAPVVRQTKDYGERGN